MSGASAPVPRRTGDAAGNARHGQCTGMGADGDTEPEGLRLADYQT
jgi:hypothetical protein